MSHAVTRPDHSAMRSIASTVARKVGEASA
jgi:hypothetical protein